MCLVDLRCLVYLWCGLFGEVGIVVLKPACRSGGHTLHSLLGWSNGRLFCKLMQIHLVKDSSLRILKEQQWTEVPEVQI